MLTKALTLKFGQVPERMQQQISLADIELNERRFEQLLVADHLNDVFK